MCTVRLLQFGIGLLVFFVPDFVVLFFVCFVILFLAVFLDDILFHGFLCLGKAAVVHSVPDCIFIVLLAQIGQNGSINLVMEHGRKEVRKVLFDISLNLVIILRRLGAIGGFHEFLVIIDGSVALCTFFILICIHDIRHIKGVVLCQPGIQNQQLLNLRLGAGILYRLQRFLLAIQNGFAIVFRAQAIGVGKGLDHHDQFHIAILAVSDLLHSVACQDQHLAQNAQAIFPSIFVIFQEERRLDTVNIAVIGKNIQILLIVCQNGLNLARCQGDRFTIRIQNRDALQFIGDRDDFGGIFVHFHIFGSGNIIVREIEIIRIEPIREAAVRHGHNGHFRFLLGCGFRFFRGLGCGRCFFSSFDRRRRLFILGSRHGEYHHAEHHGKSQQHAQEAPSCLCHFRTSFHCLLRRVIRKDSRVIGRIPIRHLLRTAG